MCDKNIFLSQHLSVNLVVTLSSAIQIVLLASEYGSLGKNKLNRTGCLSIFDALKRRLMSTSSDLEDKIQLIYFFKLCVTHTVCVRDKFASKFTFLFQKFIVCVMNQS